MWCMRPLRRTGRFPCVPGFFNPALIWEIMKKVLVTGSSGFIGRHLVSTFADRGYEVGEIDIAHPHNPFDARQFFKGRGPDVDVVVHAAAVVGGRKKVVGSPLDHAENLEIDAALFRWARENRPGRVVYFSSSCAYPVNQQRGKNQLHEDDISLSPGKDMFPDELYGWTICGPCGSYGTPPINAARNCPPAHGWASYTTGRHPCRARYQAAVAPVMPAPTTTQVFTPGGRSGAAVSPRSPAGAGNRNSQPGRSGLPHGNSRTGAGSASR